MAEVSGRMAAVDQVGDYWLVFSKSGSQWAAGLDENGMPMIRYMSNSEIVTDWRKPNSLRKLTVVS